MACRLEWEKKKADDLKGVIKVAKNSKKLQDARLKNLRACYGKAKQIDLAQIEAEINDIEDNRVQVPVIPRLWTQDVTSEKTGMRLSENHERLSNFSAEGGIFDIISGGRYNNKVPNLDVYLQAHAGYSVRVDRAGRDRGSFFLDKPTFTFGLSPQPYDLKRCG